MAWLPSHLLLRSKLICSVKILEKQLLLQPSFSRKCDCAFLRGIKGFGIFFDRGDFLTSCDCLYTLVSSRLLEVWDPAYPPPFSPQHPARHLTLSGTCKCLWVELAYSLLAPGLLLVVLKIKRRQRVRYVQISLKWSLLLLMSFRSRSCTDGSWQLPPWNSQFQI